MFEEIRTLALLQDSCFDDNNEYRRELLESLPHIVVVGSQSVGKTSLLESLIGFDEVFPKGTGSMVTRCAVALQLGYARDIDFEAELLNSANGLRTTYYSPADLRDALEKHMHEIKDWISEDLIRVRIRSSQTTDLCLMDLPGLIQLPSKDQPDDLDIRIKTLVKKYAANHSLKTSGSIILAVTCATNDLANSEALRIARELDPQGERTIGVLTKCDLLIDPQSISQMINSTVHSQYPLKLGYIFISNRQPNSGGRRIRSSLASTPTTGTTKTTNGDLDGLKSSTIEVTRSRTLSGGGEIDIFENDAFKNVQNMCGPMALRERLSRVLAAGIRHFVDERYLQIRKDIMDIELELRDLGPGGLEVNAPSLILTVVAKYLRSVDDLLEGRIAGGEVGGGFSQADEINDENAPSHWRAGDSPNPSHRRRVESPTTRPQQQQQSSSELIGGARLNFVFQDWFRPEIMKLDGLEYLDDFEIRTAIRNSSGCSSSLFIPESVFEALARKQIRRLETPIVQCVKESVKELKQLLKYPLRSGRILELRKYPQLLDHILQIINNCVDERYEICLTCTRDLIKSEMAYIDKNHPDFGCERERLQESYIQSPHQINPSTAALREMANSSPADPLFRQGETSIPHTSFMGYLRKPPFNSAYFKAKMSPNTNQTPPSRAVVEQNQESSDTLHINIVKSLVRSYFAIVKKSLAAFVPKVIMNFLVYATREIIYEQLVRQLYDDKDLFKSLLTESSEITDLRIKLQAKQRTLQDAAAILERLHNKPNIA